MNWLSPAGSRRSLGIARTVPMIWLWSALPQDVAVLAPGEQPEITLVTCYPFDFVGSAPRRFVVKARLVSPESVNGEGALTSLQGALERAVDTFDTSLPATDQVRR